ncbi:MAG: DUF2333 family protein [Kordiimonadaceae bacterium]|nr:DUF2333 family protein [Kordiimonadaceae bacterium]
MAQEIWLWITEQLQQFRGWLARIITNIWRWLAGWLQTVSGSSWRKIAAGAPLLFFLYIGIGMPFVHRVDDAVNPNIKTPPGGSYSVAAMAFLVNRETKTHNWTPNDPFFLPGSWIDNTPNYQKGMIRALSRFGFELRDQLGRTRGSSAVDVGLEKAAGNLSKEPDRWILDFGTSFLPTTASDVYYREGADELEKYNAKLAAGEAIFERRADNLLNTLDRIALDLGASSAALEEYIGKHAGGFLPDFGADDLFYQVKGQVYAYALILKALRQDFTKVIEDRELRSLYDELLKSMTDAATLDPMLVTNGAADGTIANHLSTQGFYLLRARTQLKEVTNILLK